MKINNIGLDIIKKYQPEAEILAENDQIYVGVYKKNEMTKDDLKILDDTGWYPDNEDECWSHDI